MNYYNEHDPKTAAWLRQLIAAGLIPHGIVTGLGQALRGCSASCRAARGTLDKEPIPLTAICNSVSFSIVRSSRSPACGRHQERETLHTTRTPSERSGYACENESDLSPVTVFLLSAGDTENSYLVFFHEMFSRTSLRSTSCTHQNKATCYSDPEGQERKRRTSGMNATHQRQPDFSYDSGLCTFQSRTYDGRESQPFQNRIRHKVELPCVHSHLFNAQSK